jgi:hypothetical protein
VADRAPLLVGGDVALERGPDGIGTTGIAHAATARVTFRSEKVTVTCS